jgi:hypothetical protein
MKTQMETQIKRFASTLEFRLNKDENGGFQKN